MRPATGVITLAGKFIDARIVGAMRYKERAHSADKKSRRVLGSIACTDVPSLGTLVKKRLVYPGFERNVLAQVKSIRNMLQVSSDLITSALSFSP